MKTRAHDAEAGCQGHGSFGDFLRSLLAGIPWSDRAEVLESVHFGAPRSRALRIENSNGKTRILGEQRDDIEVRLQKIARAENEGAAKALAEATRLVANETDTSLDLEIAMPRKWNRRGVVNMEIRVPTGTRVEISASNGRVCIHGLHASVKAHSSNGAVSVEAIEGDVEVQSSNAKVHCAGVHGKLVARTSNGKIAVSLPEQVDADVDVRVDNGLIRSQRSLCRCTHSTGGRLTGQLGKGGVPIKLRTSNGSVSVK